MKVLSLSIDPELSRLRQFVLEAGGHDVTSLLNERDALEAVESEAEYEAVFICHRFPSSTARQVVRLMRQHHPSTRVVYLVHVYGEWPEVEADRYIVGADGPSALTGVLEQLRTDAAPLTKNDTP